MAIAKLIETETNSLNGITKKELVLSCDICQKQFTRTKNVPRTMKRAKHFCGNSYSSKFKLQNESNRKIAVQNFKNHFAKMKTDIKYKTEIDNKIITVCQEKFGANTPLESSEIRTKAKQTLIERYGVDNPLKSKTIFEIVKKTCLEKYGHEYQIASKSTRTKIETTNLERYGSRSSAPKIYKILENNQYMTDWLREQEEPKPLKEQLYRTLPKEVLTIAEMQKFLVDWRNNKTSLEMRAEKLLGVSFYNKKVPNTINNMGYRPDFKMSDKIYVNVDGAYWHSSAVIEDKKHHIKMRKAFEENGFRLFQFGEDEIVEKPDIVRSIVLNAMGKSNYRIFARKCSIEIIEHKIASEFLVKNHLMGTTNAKHVGLLYEGQIIAIMSYRVIKNTILKIERFCSLIEHNVIGGFSKLLNYIEGAISRYSALTEIHNWVDLRYGTGEHLATKGFTRRSESCGWRWYDGYHYFNRLACRANMDERRLSQRELAEELGWEQVYDAGQRLFIKKLSSA